MKTKKRWKPKMGERFYFFEIGPCITGTDYLTWEGHEDDEDMWRTGNCFKTRKEATQALKRVKKALRGEG